MGSLTTCLRKAGNLIAPEVRAAILEHHSTLRQEGAELGAAARQAVATAIEHTRGKLDEVQAAAKEGRTLYEPAQAPAAQPEAAAQASVDRAAAEVSLLNPDLLVQLDGMDAPARVGDLMEAIKREAAHDTTETTLVQAAAACALRS